MRNRRTLALLFALALTGSAAVTFAEGTPMHLPGVALGSAVLLHIERSVAVFLAFVAGAVVLIRTARGDLPTELGARGLRYAEEAGALVRRAIEKTDALSEDLEAQRANQEQTLEIIDRLDTDVTELKALAARK